MWLSDVDQSPLTGTEANDTRPPRFGAVFELRHTEGNESEAVARLGERLEGIGAVRGYRARARHVLPDPRRPAPLGMTPGFAMVAPVYRAAALEHEEFDAHWRDRHGPLALTHHIGMWRYSQYPIDEILTTGAPPFDGVAALYFETVPDFVERLFDSAEGQRIIAEDTERFLALDRSEAALMSETLLASGALP